MSGKLSSAPVAGARRLTQRHFVMQGERPAHLRDIPLAAIEPSLRTLLFTDGTVTRTLEAQELSGVFVDVFDQQNSLVSGDVAGQLIVPEGTKSVQRRVVIGTEASVLPMIWAESHIVPSRLPKGFLGLLGDAPEGIGESLQQVRLESWREMLWFGLDSPPEWGGEVPHTPTVLKRLYRVITQGRPALLISESFAVEQQPSGTYHLIGAVTAP